MELNGSEKPDMGMMVCVGIKYYIYKGCVEYNQVHRILGAEQKNPEL
jgi:hypothetical protein